MKKLFSILLLGTLSLLFAEVFSGASTQWFLDGWGWLLTLPLYLGHCLFFYWIAYKSKKTSLIQLYFLGILFALYESWITKVLWAGYINEAGPGMGLLAGIAFNEFSILTFFWHPIFSFILPILTFEVITGNMLVSHHSILTKTKKKTFLIIGLLILVSTFVANGNGHDLGSTLASLLGTYLLIFIFELLSKETDLTMFHFKKIGFVFLSLYLVGLYLWSFFMILPERLPQTLLPYLSILFWYIVGIVLFHKTKANNAVVFSEETEDLYSRRDLWSFAFLMLVFSSLSSVLPSISGVVMYIGYLGFSLFGIGLFVKEVLSVMKKKSFAEAVIVEEI